MLTVLDNANNPGGAKVFDGVSEAEVKQYFTELTGEPLPQGIPVKPNTKANGLIVPGGTVYPVLTANGNFTLRNFSSSTGNSEAAWTIEIQKTKLNSNKNKLEIKFR